jgi:hypothetical protein
MMLQALASNAKLGLTTTAVLGGLQVVSLAAKTSSNAGD